MLDSDRVAPLADGSAELTAIGFWTKPAVAAT